MTTHPNRGRTPRPLEHLNAASQLYPDAWRHVDTLRADRGTDGLPDWPDWCFLPMGGWYSIVSADAGVDRLSLDLIPDVARLTALGAWRYTQGIYRLDPDLFTAVAGTVPKGAMPTDVLQRLPEWSLYIETPGIQWLGSDLFGFFASLEWDANTGRSELRLLLDTEDNLTGIALHLGNWTITEAVDRFVGEAQKQGQIAGIKLDVPTAGVVDIASAVYPLISLLLYVCSNGVDYPDTYRPARAKPTRTKKGWRLFPAAKPHVWRLGEKTGDAIRQAQTASGDRKGPAPHIRRAHWHGYWTGPRDGDRQFDLQWLPPTVVAADDEKTNGK